MSDIRAGRFAPVYILSGEETYYIDRISRALQSSVVSEEDADFNKDIFYGADSDVGAVITAARQFPVFSEKRLVMLNEAQAMPRAKTALDAMKSYMEQPLASTVLVVVFKGESLPATSRWIKNASASGGIVFNSPKIRDYQLPDLIRKYCSGQGIFIDEKSVFMLCDNVGSDLSRLFGEIEKLKRTVGDNDRLSITPDLIESHIGISKDYNNYELSGALLLKDYAKAMRIVTYFGKNQKENPAPVTISVIFNTFVRIMKAHTLKDKSASSLRSALGLFNPEALNQTVAGLRNYSFGSCMRIIREIRRFDSASKGVDSRQPVEALLKELVYKIFIS